MSANIKLKKWQRIFVNRSLNFASIRAVGFDMDHTLANYSNTDFESLAFKCTLEKLIEHGYPEELSRLKFDPKAVIRGLLVDRERGNLLKMDCYKYVKHAFHGKHSLKKEERHNLYNSQSFKADSFLSVDTFFALSEVHLFVEIVEFMNKHSGRIKKSFKEIYADLRKFIDLSHQDGSIKKEVIKNPQRFIQKDPSLVTTLQKLAEGGKTLFLLTNSNYSYTHEVMSYLLSDPKHPELKWQDFFDIVIVSGGKPDFFTMRKAFCEVDMKTGAIKKSQGGFHKYRVYSGGNAELFEEWTNFQGDEILYVGDHIYGDIISSKGRLNWRTMLILPELDIELPILQKKSSDVESIQELLHRREELDEKAQILRSRISSANHLLQQAHLGQKAKRIRFLAKEMEKSILKLDEREEEIEILEEKIRISIKNLDQAVHPVWGELMKVGLEKSRFAQQVEQYACLYTSRVSNLRFYSPTKKFISARDILPHDL